MNDQFITVNNGIILPITESKGGVLNKGGVLRDDGKFVEESKYIGDWFRFGAPYPFDRSGVHHADLKVIFLGYFVKQWGHFLVDCLNRAWFLCEIDKAKYKDYKIVFLNSDNILPSGNYLKFFELLGFSKRDFVLVDSPTCFKEIVIPTPANPETSKNLFVEPFKKASSAVVSDKYHGDNIYLSRLHFPDARKKELGEHPIQRLFEDNGFKILYPESMSLDDQIDVFNNATTIVCMNGTIPLNVIFGNPGINLIVLNKTSLRHSNLEKVCRLIDISPIYINVYYEPIKNHPRYLGEGPFWMIPGDELREYFDSHEMSFDYSHNLLIDCAYFCRYFYLYIKYRAIALLKKLYIKSHLVRGMYHLLKSRKSPN
ncbi:glycosyltransferase 61 family protein [Bifidobacterium olomucense]|uniref:Glycosyltransferase 61 catalytic domain-containing protein n=1 Tax=Bifidobacterium olomucense TaxID=2675324 RepID=A0A7Y0EZ96_9BIFI|nr:glycosyltransferase 61 family protein [Bifidobacterium sp. DSM 109959]NMM99132.1 hypothetical protein [Bifidobacterium sp. DSM 109959]